MIQIPVCVRERKVDTSEVVEFDVGLSAVGEELGVLGVHVDGLRVEVNGKFEVVVDERLFSSSFQIRRHSNNRQWRERETPTRL